jgi:hypothetical protein
MQQPNGPIWIRVCAKQNIVPSLQQVHQYDQALQLVLNHGHQASEEIYSCIVSEQQKHLTQQQQIAQRERTTMARIGQAQQLPHFPASVNSFQNRAYLVSFRNHMQKPRSY